MLSIIVPVYNEEKSVPLLFQKLADALQDFEYEIVVINDGSKDQSFAEIKKIAAIDKRIKAINFRKNFGQTAAINAGIRYATGDILVLIDSDLENNPSDIPLLVDKLNQGCDVVSGWRKDRWEGQFLTRKLPSLLANKLISYISGVKLHDYGCTLKAYRRDVIKDVYLYGQMHRFIPVYCKWQGGIVEEIPVSYSPRQFGKSNYGIFRTYKVILDLILIKFLDKYMQRPIHFFGGIGFLSLLMALFSGLVAVYFKVTGQKDFVETPLPTLTTLFFIVGILMVMLGVLAEILMRTYYESQNKLPFTVKETVNIESI